ncbi:RNA polymerase sigma factor [Chitinophaga japonensis]|uniref:RNA polymerase sigma-70 factor (ECF subfamily) n=1 Tax=Chitinophaga japonensis TaxID=104662 RepID=A0A562T5R0_CHIJA|nr:sigma-70 family RNA polymerase sigma factor [Chitinophaga japonensis]TWI88598.1 RNA polymerase sigma-70 factor (ECF subfamily) [Chitinophaga japonensis]
MSQHVDELLMEYIRQDDHKAFEVLFVKYYSVLREVSFHYSNNSEDAEEIAADVLHQLWQKRKDIIIEKNVKAYLSTAARNATFNVLRKKILIVEELSDSIEREYCNDYADTPASFRIRDIETEIHRSLEHLTHRQREIFRLYRFHEYTILEIAQLLRLSEGTVHFQLHKAHKRLREYFRIQFKHSKQGI